MQAESVFKDVTLFMILKLKRRLLSYLSGIVYKKVYLNCSEGHLLPISKRIHARHLNSIMPNRASYAFNYHHEAGNVICNISGISDKIAKNHIQKELSGDIKVMCRITSISAKK